MQKPVLKVHNRTSPSDSEKLVYLQHALIDGSAKHVIEGLSCSGEHYTEAMIIQVVSTKMIPDAPSIKECTGKELWRLHDTVQQYLRALKAMDYKPSSPFITSSTLELKLDPSTMFEWQKHSQSSTVVPHYQDLLEFINL